MNNPNFPKAAPTCQEQVYQWHATLCAQLPTLTRSQAGLLALWSWGTVLCQSCSLSAVSLFCALALDEPQNTARQRLREWYHPVTRKKGSHRREVCDSRCFAPLLAWVLRGWNTPQLTLALDATALGDRFVVLAVCVLYRGSAIPVAWSVLPGNTPGAWNGHWLRLLRLLRAAVPRSYEVLVLSDRGLQSSRLFRRIVRLGFHPFMRIKRGATFRVKGRKRHQPVLVLAKELGGWGSVEGVAFQRDKALPCTLGVYWDKGCVDPWLILSDLPAGECQACWYGMRSWIEHGFKLTKSEGFDWQRTRMSECERVSRMWLVIAVSTLRLLSLGSAQEDAEEKRVINRGQPKACAPRQVSLFRRGWIALLVALWKGETVDWDQPLHPEPRPKPNLQRLFFSSA